MRIDIQFLLSFEHTDNSGPLRDRTNVRSWLKNSRWFIDARSWWDFFFGFGGVRPLHGCFFDEL